MGRYTSTIRADAWGQPNIDVDNPYFATMVEWTWPAGDAWSYVQLVRTVRSPAVRLEEGIPLFREGNGLRPKDWSHFSADTGNPIFMDESPPPGEWVFYTLFALDSNRVWSRAGYATCIGPDDFGWDRRLPELLPGASVSVASGVTHSADQSSTVVQFLQGPAVSLDIATSAAEAIQYFWDPLRCPPQMLPALTRSWGYRYSEPIGMARNRAILAALRDPMQGSLFAITQVSRAINDSPVSVVISNNLMLDQNDSSWEDGDFMTTRWGPKPDPENPSPPIEVRAHDPLFPPPLLAANLMHDYFLRINNAGTYKCGYAYDATTQQWSLDPVTAGIPISSWSGVRMGCYGYDEISGGTAAITLGMDIYDPQGSLIGSLTVVDSTDLVTNTWSSVPPKPAEEGAAEDPVPISDIYPEMLPDATFRAPVNWESGLAGYATPQSIAPIDATTWMLLEFESAPTTDGPSAFLGIPTTLLSLVTGDEYEISATVVPLSDQIKWQVAVSDSTATSDSSGFGLGYEGQSLTATIRWTPDGTAQWIGIEVEKPSGGWNDGSTSLRVQLASLSIRKVAAQHAYGVPWFTVSDACSIDVFVVDDGEG